VPKSTSTRQGAVFAPNRPAPPAWRPPENSASKPAEGTTEFSQREIEKFIIRQPPIGETDDYDSENSWISDGLLSSSRRRRRGDGRWEGKEWREK